MDDESFKCQNISFKGALSDNVEMNGNIFSLTVHIFTLTVKLVYTTI